MTEKQGRAGSKPQTDTSRIFEDGYNCAETIVYSFGSAGIVQPELVGVATPFGAGIGGRRDLCGILTGGLLVIGSLFGRIDPKDVGRKGLAYEKAAEYYRWFKHEKRKTKCSEIVTGKFSGHTDECVELMEEAREKLVEIFEGSGL